MRGGALIVDDIKYGYNDIEDLPEAITMEKAKMVHINDGIAFQSHHAILSSMYPAKIDIDGTPTHCAEQAYWFKLARLAGDRKAERLLRDAKDGYAAKSSRPKIPTKSRTETQTHGNTR